MTIEAITWTALTADTEPCGVTTAMALCATLEQVTFPGKARQLAGGRGNIDLAISLTSL